MKIMYIRYYAIGILISVILTGCQNAGINYKQGKTADIMTEIGSSYTNLSDEQLDAYQQMALYIQEGFRTYKIDGIYQAYFGEIEDKDTDNPHFFATDEENRYYCEILLEGKENTWKERITYTYDAEKNWYTFGGSSSNKYEPIFAEDTDWGTIDLKYDADLVAKVKDNYYYTISIAQTIDINAPIHYYSESGPTESNAYMYSPTAYDNGSYSMQNKIYTYKDERLDIDITIEYPYISYHNNGDKKSIVNEQLRKAFFYDYSSDNELVPQHQIRSGIERHYVITRQDNTYLSMRILEYNYYLGAAHPNRWETGVTINMQTGEVLTLDDVVGEGWTLNALLEIGEFDFLWMWAYQSTDGWIEEVLRHADYRNYNEYFYLTDDSLGLITYGGGDYICAEAKLGNLGIEGY